MILQKDQYLKIVELNVYYFYETSKGFNFRSWESMVSSKSNFKRAPRDEFFYQPAKIPGTDRQAQKDKALQELRTIEEYEFVNNFHDVAANSVLGTYGHRVLSYNFFNKSFKTDDYHQRYLIRLSLVY